MISKSSFWASMRENLKRRGWTVLLCMLVMFLVLPVSQAMAVSVNRQKVEAGGSYSMAGSNGREWVAETFMNAISFDIRLVAVFAAFAVLFAIQGFSWLYSRKKTDMYMSVPVSSGKRYFTIYLNGIGIFAGCYFCTLLMVLAVGAALGVLSGKTILVALGAFLCNMIFFAAVYNLSVIAVMMTGNVLVTLLACGSFFMYEYMLRFLLDGMRSAFFRTYCSFADVMDKSWTSPILTYSLGQFSANSYCTGGGQQISAAFYGRSGSGCRTGSCIRRTCLYFIPEQESGGCREVHGLYQKQKCGETAADDSGYPYGWTVVQRAFRRKYFFHCSGNAYRTAALSWADTDYL